MKKFILITALILSLFVACTRKDSSKESVPSASVEVYKNSCEKIVTGENSKIPMATVSKAFVISEEPLICHMFFQGNDKMEEALFQVEGEKIHPAYSTAIYTTPECGARAKSIKTTPLYLKFGDNTRLIIAIEEMNEQIGCCGSADKMESLISFYSPMTKETSGTLQASNYCLVDKSCGGLCDNNSKKDIGTKIQMEWENCSKEKPCEKIFFTRTDVTSPKKSKKFVLTWNEFMKLTETAAK